jgi:hypothetical protein
MEKIMVQKSCALLPMLMETTASDEELQIEKGYRTSLVQSDE